MSTTAVSLKQRPKLAFLCEHVRTVKWFQLGIQLEVDTVSLKEIHQEYSDVNEKRTKMYDEWLRTKPEASLVQLINALRSYAVQEHTIAYNLEQIYNRNKPGKQVTTYLLNYKSIILLFYSKRSGTWSATILSEGCRFNQSIEHLSCQRKKRY